MTFYSMTFYLYHMNIEMSTQKDVIWEEKNLIEPKTKYENNGTIVPKNITNEIKNEFVKKECENIGKKKIWTKICPNCGNEPVYSSEEQLKKSIENNRNCLKCGSFKKIDILE